MAHALTIKPQCWEVMAVRVLSAQNQEVVALSLACAMLPQCPGLLHSPSDEAPGL